MRWVRRILLGLVVLVVVALVGGYWYERPLLLTGTGYAAHNACAVTQVAGRQNPQSDLPPNPLVPYLRTSVDGTARTARATLLGVLAGQKAWYADGFGCTLSAKQPSFGRPTAVTSSGNPFTDAPPPAADPTVDAAVATAFGAPGTRAIIVVKDGRLVAERYADGFTSTTPQLGWSMSKSVTSLLVGRLVLDGSVKITDDHLRPTWTDDRSKITVDELMRMTSGLSWDETYSLGTPITRMLYLEPDMAAYVSARPLAHVPGTYEQYSSGSTTLLAGILAQRTGEGADLPRRELFAPLGLSSAVLEPDAVGTPVASSYMWATPRDWAAVGQLALQDGVWNGRRLLPEGWMAQTTTVTPVAKAEDAGYAAGWWANRLADGSLADTSLPPDAYYADGHDGQRIFVVPSARLVVVRLGFSPGVTEPALRVSALVHALVAAG